VTIHLLSQVNKLEITADKTQIAAAGNSQIRIYDVNSNDPQPINSFEGHNGNVTALGFQKDTKWMYSGGLAGNAAGLTQPQRSVSQCKHGRGASQSSAVLLHKSHLRLNKCNHSTLARCACGRERRAWRGATQQSSLPPSHAHDLVGSGCSEGGKTLAPHTLVPYMHYPPGGEDGTVRIWDLRAPGCQRSYESRAAVNSVQLHPNQGELISGLLAV